MLVQLIKQFSEHLKLKQYNENQWRIYGRGVQIPPRIKKRKVTQY